MTALFILGALLVFVAGLDLFLTVFNYDGYTFVSRWFHRGLWRVVRFVGGALPGPLRHITLSVGSAAMLPALVVLWLGLEVAGFGLMLADRLGVGNGMYLSGGAISSLAFADVLPHGALDRALVTMETVVGLATITLALGYVVTAFGALDALEDLHGYVRRHADDPLRSSSILARHFRGGAPNELPSLLASLGESLERYDRGLRRYPVVYYFHPRRELRSIPHVFTMLGDLISLLRWGLPAAEPLTQDPFLAALIDGYAINLNRLRGSFVGPHPIDPPEPATRAEYDAGEADSVRAFAELRRRALSSTGVDHTDTDDEAYERYREWFPFAHHQRVVIERVADRLGYPRPSSTTRPRDEKNDRFR